MLREQRNPYVGSPARCCARLQLVHEHGTTTQLTLLADTGNPCALIVSKALALQFRRMPAPALHTNFGLLRAAWFRVVMPDLGFDQDVLGYDSDVVVAGAKASDPTLQGLLGLPLLRLLEYGGDGQFFWLRNASGHP